MPVPGKEELTSWSPRCQLFFAYPKSYHPGQCWSGFGVDTKTSFLLHPPLSSGPDQTEPSFTTVCKHSASSNMPWKPAVSLDFSSGFILGTCLMYLELEGPDLTCMPPHLSAMGTRRSRWLLGLERSLWEFKAVLLIPQNPHVFSHHFRLSGTCCPHL